MFVAVLTTPLMYVCWLYSPSEIALTATWTPTAGFSVVSATYALESAGDVTRW